MKIFIVALLLAIGYAQTEVAVGGKKYPEIKQVCKDHATVKVGTTDVTFEGALGAGGLGQVCKATVNGEQVAIKLLVGAKMALGQKALDEAQKECDAMKAIEKDGLKNILSCKMGCTLLDVTNWPTPLSELPERYSYLRQGMKASASMFVENADEVGKWLDRTEQRAAYQSTPAAMDAHYDRAMNEAWIPFFKKGWIHGDASVTNIMINTETEVFTVIDVEMACKPATKEDLIKMVMRDIDQFTITWLMCLDAPGTWEIMGGKSVAANRDLEDASLTQAERDETMNAIKLYKCGRRAAIAKTATYPNKPTKATVEGWFANWQAPTANVCDQGTIAKLYGKSAPDRNGGPAEPAGGCSAAVPAAVPNLLKEELRVASTLLKTTSSAQFLLLFGMLVSFAFIYKHLKSIKSDKAYLLLEDDAEI